MLKRGMSAANQGPPSPPTDLPTDCSATHLFAQLWDNLADLLGVAATATLLRRSAKRVTSRAPGQPGITITRDGFTYRYALPESWSGSDREQLVPLCHLVQELMPLLAELTGPVAVRRIRNLPDFRRCGLISPEDD